jgi:zinc/manganese transport system substrate-binding protein
MYSKIVKRLCLTAFLGLGIHLPIHAALRIVATTPDLADITRQVGGDFVKVESLARGTEDIHSVPQRPSFLPKLNRADGVVLQGLEVEHAFLPALLEVAQNPRILRGRPGYLDCSEKVKVLEVPVDLSRAQGELHPLGNPHYNVDPRNGGLIADTITEGLSRLDPTHAADFGRNRDAFKKALAAKMAEWEKLIGPVRGMKAVSHHQDMTYLADFLGLQLVGTVELKPGIASTPTHLEKLAQQMKAEKVPLILREAQYTDKTARWLAQQTGARIAAVATMAGAFPDSSTYFGMIEHNFRAIVDALK